MHLRFTIRDLLWFFLAIALSLGWLGEAKKVGDIRAESTAREGAWTIAVGELPLPQQEALRKAQEHSLKQLRSGK